MKTVSALALLLVFSFAGFSQQPAGSKSSTTPLKAFAVIMEGANHAFFDWKPDAQTKAVFVQYGVPYAAEMKAFFDTVF